MARSQCNKQIESTQTCIIHKKIEKKDKTVMNWIGGIGAVVAQVTVESGGKFSDLLEFVALNQFGVGGLLVLVCVVLYGSYRIVVWIDESHPLKYLIAGATMPLVILNLFGEGATRFFVG